MKLLSSNTRNKQIPLSNALFYGSCPEFRESVLARSQRLNEKCV